MPRHLLYFSCTEGRVYIPLTSDNSQCGETCTFMMQLAWQYVNDVLTQVCIIQKAATLLSWPGAINA